MTIRQQIAENKHYPIESIKCSNCHYHIRNADTNEIICQCDRKVKRAGWACKYFRLGRYS